MRISWNVLLLGVWMCRCGFDPEVSVARPTAPIALGPEAILYENGEFNNCGQKAVYCEEHQKTYVVFSRVPPTLTYSDIMFVTLDENGQVDEAPRVLGTVRTTRAFPNIAADRGRILVTWHGNETTASSEGLTIAELSGTGEPIRRLHLERSFTADFKGNSIVVAQGTMYYFYNTEIEEDNSRIAFYALDLVDSMSVSASGAIGDNGSLVHHACFYDRALSLTVTESGSLAAATFDTSTNSLTQRINLASLDRTDPHVSYTRFGQGESVASFSNTSEDLTLRFFDDNGRDIKREQVSRNAYSYSNFLVDESHLWIAWVTQQNTIACTQYDLSTMQLYREIAVSENSRGIAIEPSLVAGTSGITVMWRDCRNNNGGDLYYRLLMPDA